ncbi:MAG TPA: metalloregulator ArsR/SmtB family transcription factor [candidate division Zixibacteria bacterium]|nr:metalloregulator ArsR/SmtB family transcription factor [candidate division Zixibacteria bacterium]
MTISGEPAAERDIRRLRTLYRALGDQTRLRVIGLLAELGPMPVNALSARVGLSQPLISWHLRILRLAGLIETRRQGREVICRLRREAFEELRETEARLIGGTSGVGSARPRAAARAEVSDVG